MSSLINNRRHPLGAGCVPSPPMPVGTVAVAGKIVHTAHAHNRKTPPDDDGDDDDDAFFAVHPHPCIPAVVSLNVSGEVLQVSAKTLSKAPSSVLYQLVRRLYLARKGWQKSRRKRQEEGNRDPTNEKRKESIEEEHAEQGEEEEDSDDLYFTRDAGVCTDEQGRLYLDHDPRCVRYLINRLRGYSHESCGALLTVVYNKNRCTIAEPLSSSSLPATSSHFTVSGGDGGGPLVYGSVASNNNAPLPTPQPTANTNNSSSSSSSSSNMALVQQLSSFRTFFPLVPPHVPPHAADPNALVGPLTAASSRLMNTLLLNTSSGGARLLAGLKGHSERRAGGGVEEEDATASMTIVGMANNLALLYEALVRDAEILGLDHLVPRPGCGSAMDSNCGSSDDTGKGYSSSETEFSGSSSVDDDDDDENDCTCGKDAARGAAAAALAEGAANCRRCLLLAGAGAVRGKVSGGRSGQNRARGTRRRLLKRARVETDVRSTVTVALSKVKITAAGTSNNRRTLSSRLVVGLVGNPIFLSQQTDASGEQTACSTSRPIGNWVHTSTRNCRKYEMSFLVEECDLVGIGIISDDTVAAEEGSGGAHESGGGSVADLNTDFGESLGCACYYSSGKISHKFPTLVSEHATMRFGSGCIVTIVVDLETRRVHWEVGGHGALSFTDGCGFPGGAPPPTAATTKVSHRGRGWDGVPSSSQNTVLVTALNGQQVPTAMPNAAQMEQIVRGRVVAVASFAAAPPSRCFRFAVLLQGSSSVSVTSRPTGFN